MTKQTNHDTFALRFIGLCEQMRESRPMLPHNICDPVMIVIGAIEGQIDRAIRNTSDPIEKRMYEAKLKQLAAAFTAYQNAFTI